MYIAAAGPAHGIICSPATPSIALSIKRSQLTMAIARRKPRRAAWLIGSAAARALCLTGQVIAGERAATLGRPNSNADDLPILRAFPTAWSA